MTPSTGIIHIVSRTRLPGGMTFATGLGTARILGAIRFALLALASLAVAHDATFAAEYGIGAGFVRAMSAGGHDGYWPAFSVVVVAAVTVLGLWSAVRLGRLLTRGGAHRRANLTTAGRPRRTYRRELRALWTPLFLLTAVAFAVQENIEHVVGHGHVIGLGALIGPEYPLALPVIGLVTLAAAALGALVRWRVAVLEARIAGCLDEARPRGLAATRPGPGWADIAAIRIRAWFLVRLDAGRAPPLAD
jgi:hypothetical protein